MFSRSKGGFIQSGHCFILNGYISLSWSHWNEHIYTMISIGSYRYDHNDMIILIWSYLYDHIDMIILIWPYWYDYIDMTILIWPYWYDHNDMIILIWSYWHEHNDMIISCLYKLSKAAVLTSVLYDCSESQLEPNWNCIDSKVISLT